MHKIENETFTETTVTIDNMDFVGCTFTKCTMVYHGYFGVNLTKRQFNECKWVFRGPAGTTMGLLKAMRKPDSGMAYLFDQTFKDDVPDRPADLELKNIKWVM